MLNWLLFGEMPFPASFIIPASRIIPSYPGKIYHCLEFLSFYQIDQCLSPRVCQYLLYYRESLHTFTRYKAVHEAALPTPLDKVSPSAFHVSALLDIIVSYCLSNAT